MSLLKIFSLDASTQPYKDEINANVPQSINNTLKQSFSYTPEQEKALVDLLTPVFGDGDKDWSNILSSAEALLKEVEDKIENNTEKELENQQRANTAQEEKEASDNRIEQEAEVSLKLTEPKLTDTNYTSVVDNQDINNSLGEDYPNSHGIISDDSGFIKLNRLTKQAMVVHSSGTRIVIDGNGNTTLFVKGTFKIVGDGDTAMEFNGNLDISANGGIYIHGKEMKVISDGHTLIKSSELTCQNSKTDFVDTTEVNAMSATLNVGIEGNFGGTVSAPNYQTI